MKVRKGDLAHALTCPFGIEGPCLRCLVLYQAARAAGSPDCPLLMWEGPEPVQPLAPLLERPKRRHVEFLMARRAAFHVASGAPLCGAQTWGDASDEHDDPNAVWLHGTCQKPVGHPEDWHHEYRDGSLWAEWSGGRLDRLPADAVIVNNPGGDRG